MQHDEIGFTRKCAECNTPQHEKTTDARLTLNIILNGENLTQSNPTKIRSKSGLPVQPKQMEEGWSHCYPILQEL